MKKMIKKTCTVLLTLVIAGVPLFAKSADLSDVKIVTIMTYTEENTFILFVTDQYPSNTGCEYYQYFSIDGANEHAKNRMLSVLLSAKKTDAAIDVAYSGCTPEGYVNVVRMTTK